MAHVEHPRGLHNDNAIYESCKFSRGLTEFQHASRMLETEQIITDHGWGGGKLLSLDFMHLLHTRSLKYAHISHLIKACCIFTCLCLVKYRCLVK